MSIASDYRTRYNKLPEEWIRELDIWGGDCSVSQTMHYGEPFNTFFKDMKADAVEFKEDKESLRYTFIFSDGSRGYLDDWHNSFCSRD
jgi:hypothetical protein